MNTAHTTKSFAFILIAGSQNNNFSVYDTAVDTSMIKMKIIADK